MLRIGSSRLSIIGPSRAENNKGEAKRVRTRSTTSPILEFERIAALEPFEILGK
jgi:hypothetical protein